MKMHYFCRINKKIKMILIYTPRITKRISYIFKLYFEQIMGLKFELTTKTDVFKALREQRSTIRKAVLMIC